MRALLTRTLPFRLLPSANPSRRFTAASRVISSPFPISMSTNSDAIAVNPCVDSLQQVLQSYPADGWDKCWEQGLTPWDLGRPTPVVEHLCRIGALPKGRALVPGCGSGFDVVCMACPERIVVGLDVSDKALQRAAKLHSSSANADNFVFIKEDFFTWNTTEFFNLIFDYTFFCAIEPELRPTWAQRVADLLRPDGELITLMFPISDHAGGPPYKVSLSDYEEVLFPLGFKAISIEDNELAIRSRKRENRKVEEINPVLSLNEAYEAKIKDLQKLAEPLQVLLKHLSFV